MFTRPATASAEAARGHRGVQRRDGRTYDWRLRGRWHGATAGSAPDALPSGLFQSGGSPGSLSRGGDGGGDRLLHPGRRSAATPDFPPASTGTAPFLWPATDTSGSPGRPGSRTTSVNSSFDGAEERCIHAAYRVSFPGDRRIQELPTRVLIGGRRFLLVERVVRGSSDAVYQRSRKVWEHVPRGQVKVFAASAVTAGGSARSQLGSPVGVTAPPSGGTDGVGGPTPSSPRPTRSGSPFSSMGSTPVSTTHAAVLALSGLRKFAHWGDTSASTYNVSGEVPDTAIAVSKVDGEGCQAAAFVYEGERYWVIGLRDRHLLVRLDVPEEDVVAYAVEDTAGRVQQPSLPPHEQQQQQQTRAQLARTQGSMRVARAWRHLLRSRLSVEDVQELHARLSEHQWTLCFDAVLDGFERFVDYDASDSESGEGSDQDAGSDESPPGVKAEEAQGLAQDRTPGLWAPPASPAPDGAGVLLFFYAITTNESSEKGLCLPVAESMAVFSRFQLPTVPYSEPLEVNSSAYDALRAEVAAARNSAGVVFYGANAAGLVVRLWKCRCHAYELERAAQEFIVTHRMPGALFLAKFRKKLSGLAREVRASAHAWERDRLPFLAALADWLHETRQLTPSTDLAALQELRGHWLTAQHAFRQATRTGRGAASGVGESPGGAGGVDLVSASAASSPVGSVSAVSVGWGPDSGRDGAIACETIVLTGPQGCGKSTVARALYALLEQAGCTPRWVNQDEVGSRRAYMAAVARAAASGHYSHLILDKMNLDEAARDDYAELHIKTVLTVAWSHQEGPGALADVCFERVRRRGAGHRTFKVSLDLEERPDGWLAADGAGSPASSPSPPPMPPDAQLRRMRGIVLDCATRYELPSSGAGVLELDVTLHCHATLQRVWARLRDRSLHELPPLTTLNAEEALRIAVGYEEVVRDCPGRVHAAVLEAVSADDVHRLVGRDLVEGGGKRVTPSVQVVLRNFVEHPSPTALVRYAALAGRVVDVTARAVVADARATLLVLSIALPAGVPSGGTGAGGGDGLPPVGGGGGEPCMAILAKARRTNHRHCAELFERAVLRAEEDPYVQVRPLPPGTVIPFTYTLVTPS